MSSLKKYLVKSVTGALILNKPWIWYNNNILPMIKYQIET